MKVDGSLLNSETLSKVGFLCSGNFQPPVQSCYMVRAGLKLGMESEAQRLSRGVQKLSATPGPIDFYCLMKCTQKAQ